MKAASGPPRAPPLPLDMAKIVEERRRSRIDRARQLSMNIELQRSILHTTELYNLDAERRRLQVALDSSLGPACARTVREVQMETMTRRAEQLEASAVVPTTMLIPGRQRLRRQANGGAAAVPRNGRPNMTLDHFAEDRVVGSAAARAR